MEADFSIDSGAASFAVISCPRYLAAICSRVALLALKSE